MSDKPIPKASSFIIESKAAKGSGYSSVRVPAAEAFFWLTVTCMEQQLCGASRRRLYAVKQGKDLGAPAIIPVRHSSDIYF